MGDIRFLASGYEPVVVDYLYELRRGEEVLATGRLRESEPLAVGDRIALAGRTGVVRTIEPQLGNPTMHVLLEADEE